VPQKKGLKAAYALFQTDVENRLRRLGAVATDSESYNLLLTTPIGPLHIHVMDDGWIATRFEDVVAGRRFTFTNCGHGYDSNPFSGKWNFHYPEDPKVLSDPTTPDLFFRYIATLLTYKPVPVDAVPAE
jgi:hypothetical protein